MSALLDSLQAGFETLDEGRVDALGLGPARRASLRRSLADGLPSQRSEIWKYTALRALGARTFSHSAPAAEVAASELAQIPGPRLVFVNGVFSAQHSLLQELPDGLTLRPLSALLQSGTSDDAVASSFQSDAGPADQAFARLNAALAVEGTLLEVTAAAEIGPALHLVFVSTPAEADIASHLRHLVRIGAGAQLRLVEHHVSVAAHRHLGNHVLDLELGADARVVHARLQDEDAGASLIARSLVRLGDRASYRRLDLEMGAALSRHELQVMLDGPGASFVSGGAMLAGARRHLDTRLRVLHSARDCQCDLLWRGLAADRSRLAFHGGIVIAAGADGSDARLSNKNLLLSAGAEIDTQPVLEIHADEVKAAHGATVGRLDTTALFYLRSRGIPEPEARSLLTQAFCRQALGVLDDADLLAFLTPRLEARLLGLEIAP